MRPGLALVLTAAFATAASAQNYDGAPTVSAEAVKGESAAVVRASVDIAASPRVVWSTLMDCEHATAFMPKVKSCTTLERDAAGRSVVREQQLEGNVLKPVMKNVYRMSFEPDRSVSFHLLKGDFKRSDGSWRITPLDGGKGSRVDYEIRVAVDGPVPVSMVRSSIAKGMPRSMQALRRYCVQQAGKAAKP